MLNKFRQGLRPVGRDGDRQFLVTEHIQTNDGLHLSVFGRNHFHRSLGAPKPVIGSIRLHALLAIRPNQQEIPLATLPT